jgi:hypothetical protein
MSVLPIRRIRTRTVVGLSLLAALLLLAGANAHLVYVAVTSQPDCVDHLREGDAAKGQGQGSFRAAKSSCSPGARS